MYLILRSCLGKSYILSEFEFTCTKMMESLTIILLLEDFAVSN